MIAILAICGRNYNPSPFPTQHLTYCLAAPELPWLGVEDNSMSNDNSAPKDVKSFRQWFRNFMWNHPRTETLCIWLAIAAIAFSAVVLYGSTAPLRETAFTFLRLG